jgi:superfamily I DNA/RNA helicase
MYLQLEKRLHFVFDATFFIDNIKGRKRKLLTCVYHMQEERRCAYVGVSRARVKLSITFLVGGFWGDPLSGVGEPWYPSR